MKPRVVGWAAVYVAIVAALLYAQYCFFRTPLRAALPLRAHIVGEWEGPSPVDYSCGIVADVSPQEFDAYVQRRGLLPAPSVDTDSGTGGLCSFIYDGPGAAPPWWFRTCAGDRSFVSETQRVQERAVYQNGRLYGVLYHV